MLMTLSRNVLDNMPLPMNTIASPPKILVKLLVSLFSSFEFENDLIDDEKNTK